MLHPIPRRLDVFCDVQPQERSTTHRQRARERAALWRSAHPIPTSRTPGSPHRRDTRSWPAMRRRSRASQPPFLDQFLDGDAVQGASFVQGKIANRLYGFTMLSPAFLFAVQGANTLPDDFIDRVKASAGNLLLDQAFGFGAELNRHEKASVLLVWRK